jgi:teichoic acid transport system permease protein
MIRLARRLFITLKNVFQNRNLLFSLAWKDFKRRFAGSYFGTVWAFIQPLITIVVYWVAFQYGFKSGSLGNVPFILWFTAGIVPWLFMSEAISSASNSLLEYSYLVKKVIFQVDILPLAKIISSLFIHFFFVGLLIVICCVLGYWPTMYALQFFYYLFCSITFVFAFSLVTSSVIVFFRDLGQIINIILLIGMWVTPLFWDIGIVPEQYRFIEKLNPFFYIVQGYRDSFTEGVWFWQRYNHSIYFWVVTLLLLILGSVIFNRLKPHFPDVL